MRAPAISAEPQTAGDVRGHFIPVRKRDIIETLCRQDGLAGEDARAQFRQLCRLLGSIFHYEYFDELERLRDDYYYFNPEIDPKARFDPDLLERSYRDLLDAFLGVLEGANFVEVPHDEIERAHRERAVVRVNIRTSVDDYRDIRFFRRGRRHEKAPIKEWFGWRKREIDIEVYDDVVLWVAVKDRDGINNKGKQSGRHTVRPGCVLIKYFRHIASADLNALFPNVEVVLGLRDKLFLGVPAVVGGMTILFKLASTITVLFLVAGFYLGISSAVRDDQMAAALAALSGLVALGGLVVRQWVKFQRQSLMYQKELTDNVYFRNVNNNAGIFDYVIGAAEQQECKEAFLAYYFLLTAAQPMTQAELDDRIEHWLQERFGVDVDFEVDDALAKLERLGGLKRSGDKLSVPPLGEALVRLDGIWDNYFTFAPVPA